MESKGLQADGLVITPTKLSVNKCLSMNMSEFNG